MKIHSIQPPLASKSRPEGSVVDLIVLHATAGHEHPESSVQNAMNTLRARGLAYHYLIAKDGTVYEAVDPGRQASHAGSSYGPHEEARGTKRTQYGNTRENRRLDRVYKFTAGCSVNSYSIGISFANLNDGKDSYPIAQIAAGIALVKELKSRFRSLRWLTAHYVVSPKRKSDPVGPGFDLESFAQACDLVAWRPQ